MQVFTIINTTFVFSGHGNLSQKLLTLVHIITTHQQSRLKPLFMCLSLIQINQIMSSVLWTNLNMAKSSKALSRVWNKKIQSFFLHCIPLFWYLLSLPHINNWIYACHNEGLGKDSIWPPPLPLQIKLTTLS